MLPVYSLDGGRVLVALLEKKFDRKKIVNALRVVGIVLSLGLFGVFIVSCFYGFSLTLGVASIFLFISSTSAGEGKYKKIHMISKICFVKNNVAIEQKQYLISSEARLIDLYRKLNSKYFSVFVVVDQENLKINETLLIDLIQRHSASHKLCEVL